MGARGAIKDDRAAGQGDPARFVNTLQPLRRGGARAAAILTMALLVAPVLAGETPPASGVPATISHYHRITPTVATAGLLAPGGLAAAAELGFALVIDLRTAQEGATRERDMASRLGVRYLNIPVATRAPTPAQVATLAGAIEDPANQPVLIHCHTANRAGAMWALYQARAGASTEAAMVAGRAAGLAANREDAVRARIAGTPPAGASPPAASGDDEADGNPFDSNGDDDMGC